MWQQKDKYYMTNNGSTICKVKLGDKLTYELWHKDKQYAGFNSADEAKQKYEEVTR